MRFTFALIVCSIGLVSVITHAQMQNYGIVGKKAPGWGVTEWINPPQRKKSVNVQDYEGKVLYLYGFQSWCPGCHSRVFPTLQALIEHYKDEKDVAFVAVQTSFEGFSTNTADAAWQTAKRYDLNIPVGHSGSQGKRSTLMQRYRTGGTPWTIIIDKQGIVRFNNFHIQPTEAIRLIDRLNEVKESPPEENEKPIKTLPSSRGGQGRIGEAMPEFTFDHWLNTVQPKPQQKNGNATLYRWWTDTCPYCEASLPAIEQLRKKYESKGLRVVCVYHPKPPQAVTNEQILKAAKSIGYEGEVAVDLDWSELHRAYGDADDWSATSVSFLVDQEGIIRFVHPGPIFFPSDNSKFKQENEDFEILDRAINQLVSN